MGSTSANPYTSQSAPANYNQNPPPDDGTNVAANEITWAKHKDKLADPLKIFGEAINIELLLAFAKTLNTDDDVQNQITGNLGFGDSELTIDATGLITPTRSHHRIDTFSDAATDDLANIATASFIEGGLLILRAENTARTVVVKNLAGGAGQIHLSAGADYSLDDTDKSLWLQRRGTDWYETPWDNTAALADQQGLLAVQTFTASGTYTPTVTPANADPVSDILVIAVAGGGGGGGSNAGTVSGGGGGGGGTAIEFIDATALVSETVTIGPGGTGGSTSGTDGNTGGTTSLGALLSATGGAGGGGAAMTTEGGTGGIGSGGDLNLGGGGGGAGNQLSIVSGVGGDSVFGGGGAGVQTDTNGLAGRNYGGGASGAGGTLSSGGTGGGGVIYILEFVR